MRPDQLTKTAVETYLAQLDALGYILSSRARTKSAISGFAQWLIEEKEVLRRNPTRGVDIPAQPLLAPRQLSPDQRYVLRELVEREGTARSAALFALGYWAGCRVSDVSWLRRADAHIGPQAGWLHVGYKGGKARNIDLVNEAQRPLYQYLAYQAERAARQLVEWSAGADEYPAFVFTSQRAQRLTERGIHHWLQRLRERATKRPPDPGMQGSNIRVYALSAQISSSRGNASASGSRSGGAPARSWRSAGWTIASCRTTEQPVDEKHPSPSPPQR